ncbi:prepilin-type N-terminal cleavage/methylation domain-containing protein [Clostridium perfringens]|uniref:prepilin-type N-terminal cleavage/methylation domain-containing protein n=1 Tax=Clostridium perfringens TaxID=1502 RepID=UPI00111FD483|nr:prepilin-type N-terminal cleavage/methylation domain-containing protein [Clostridium perfringens]TPE22228.1 prepilin-type N-terminal cleavage/methylation domain-containing protein [Clostridium perfringens]
MNIKKQNKKKKGFTLIELIIVIAIIAILAAIAIPNFLGIQRKSKVKADIASAKNIYDATSTLVADNKITADCAYVLDPNATTKDIVENSMQTIPTSKSIKGDYFEVVVTGITHETTATLDSQTPDIKVYLVNSKDDPALDSTGKTAVEPPKDGVLIYPNGSGEYDVNK